MTPQSIKAKGRNAENQFVKFLSAWWPSVERRRLAGVHDRGDIAGVPDTVIEVKSGARSPTFGTLDEYHQRNIPLRRAATTSPRARPRSFIGRARAAPRAGR